MHYYLKCWVNIIYISIEASFMFVSYMQCCTIKGYITKLANVNVQFRGFKNTKPTEGFKNSESLVKYTFFKLL